ALTTLASNDAGPLKCSGEPCSSARHTPEPSQLQAAISLRLLSARSSQAVARSASTSTYGMTTNAETSSSSTDALCAPTTAISSTGAICTIAVATFEASPLAVTV